MSPVTDWRRRPFFHENGPWVPFGSRRGVTGSFGSRASGSVKPPESTSPAGPTCTLSSSLASWRCQLQQLDLHDRKKALHYGRIALVGVLGEVNRSLQGHLRNRDLHEVFGPDFGSESMDRHEGESDDGPDPCLARLRAGEVGNA